MPEQNIRHIAALNRRRRIVVQEDANMPFEAWGMDIDTWLEHRFDHADMPGSQIDAIYWDIGLAEDTYSLYESDLLQTLDHPGLNRWRENGIDWVQTLVENTKSRELECFWNHRVCPVDFAQPWVDGRLTHDDPRRENPLKKAHPDWVNECWWPQGLWNLASAGLREHKTAMLKELLTKYRLDGIQLDFARHTPCLPPGREWEHREHATEFVRMIRTMMMQLEELSDEGLLLAVRIPETTAGCRVEGFDIHTWIEENLIDILVLGGRTSEIDIAEYRELVSGRDIKLCPTFDGHHTNDGYYFPPIEYYRGVFANWWTQGVDSVATFNWACARPAQYDRYNLPGIMKCESQSQAYTEVGELETLVQRDTTYAVERRGGYPWAGNYYYRNDDKTLPLKLEPGKSYTFALATLNEPPTHAKAVVSLILRDAGDDTLPTVQINGEIAECVNVDPAWHDSQIYGDDPQPSAGNHGAYDAWSKDPSRAYLRLTYATGTSITAKSSVKVELSAEHAEKSTPVHLEKLEVTVSDE